MSLTIPTRVQLLQPDHLNFGTQLKFNRAGMASVQVDKGFQPLALTFTDGFVHSIRSYPEWGKARLRFLPSMQDAEGIDKLMQYLRGVAGARYVLSQDYEVKDPFWQDGADRFLTVDWPKVYQGDTSDYDGVEVTAFGKTNVLQRPEQLEQMNIQNKAVKNIVVKPKIWARRDQQHVVFGLHLALVSLEF